MNHIEYSETEVNRQYDDALKRNISWTGRRVSIGTIKKFAQDGGYQSTDGVVAEGDHQQLANQPSFDLDAAVPVYSSDGMPPREFVGPRVGEAHLFPLNAGSLLVALGGVGKTTAIVKIGSHIAAGKPWGADLIKRRPVLIFCVEESREELNRKYSACVHGCTAPEQDLAKENLRLLPCLDRDPRLTRINGRQVDGSGLTEKIIEAAKLFKAEVIFLDHLQGFVSGDLNNSDTATALAREVNMIVAATGAAVIQTAHISKANINAEEVFAGFTSGSLAFENAARQVVGVIPLPDDDAKKYGLESIKDNYLMLGMAKNSYGPSRAKAYLRKDYVPDFHTVTVEPYVPPEPKTLRNASERVRDLMLEHVKNNPNTTKNKLDRLAGKEKLFKATKGQIRKALDELIDEDVLQLKSVTKEERIALGLPHQAKHVIAIKGA